MMPPVATPELAAPVPEARGDGLIRVAFGATATFVVTACGAVLFDSVRGVAALVAAVLFFSGIAAFFGAYFRAVARSRTEVLGVGGIYFLSGSAPVRVRVALLGTLALQTAVAMVTASLRPFTSLAFGMLVPMFGVGVAGLWGAIYGKYPTRPDESASVPDDE